MSEFFSEKQELISNASEFFKPEPGITTVRILTPPSVFYTVWDKRSGEPVKHVDMNAANIEQYATKDDKVKLTYGMVVYDYASGDIKPWEVTQVSIINALITFVNGGLNPLTFDINILKSGEKLQTKYTLQPMAPAELDALLLDIIESTPVDMGGFLNDFKIVG